MTDVDSATRLASSDPAPKVDNSPSQPTNSPNFTQPRLPSSALPAKHSAHNSADLDSQSVPNPDVPSFTSPHRQTSTTTATPAPDSKPDQHQYTSPKSLPPSPQIPVPRKTNPTPPPPPLPSQRNHRHHLDIPNNLPKVARNRPENARVFIGNLASEYTDVAEIVSVFYKYGHLIEEPVLRRSFGFVQYSTAEAANLAVASEQGRIIGGIAIDLSIADNREVKRGTHIANNTPFSHAPHSTKIPQHKRGRDRERDTIPQPTARKRRRSLSPASAARKGGVHPPQYRRQRPQPKAGIYLRILCMSPTAKSYARHCENTFRSMTGLKADVLHIVAAGLGEALGRAMRDVIPYVMVVASKDVEDGTCTIRTLEKTGYEKSGRGNGVIPLQEAVEVCLIERGVIAPQGMNGPGPLPPAPAPAPPPPPAPPYQPSTSLQRMPMNVNQNCRNMGAPIMSGGQWMSAHGAGPGHVAPMGSSGMEAGTAKPGWMNAARPPHPSNPRIAGPNIQSGMGGGMVSSGALYGYNGMEGGGRHGYGQGGRGEHEYVSGGPTMAAGGYESGGRMVAPGTNIGGGEYMGHGGGGGGGGYGESGYGDRYGGQGGRGSNSYGVGGGEIRESEYDPAAVMPGSRSQGGYNNWNRDAGEYGAGAGAGYEGRGVGYGGYGGYSEIGGRYGEESGYGMYMGGRRDGRRTGGWNEEGYEASHGSNVGPGTVDIGKLTNLISAFKQQQSGQAQQGGGNESGAHRQMLGVPAVEQALHNQGAPYASQQSYAAPRMPQHNYYRYK